jgi:hypothetical protein
MRLLFEIILIVISSCSNFPSLHSAIIIETTLAMIAVAGAVLLM